MYPYAFLLSVYMRMFFKKSMILFLNIVVLYAKAKKLTINNIDTDENDKIKAIHLTCDECGNLFSKTS